MDTLKKIFSSYNGQTPSTGKEVEDAFNTNFSIVKENLLEKEATDEILRRDLNTEMSARISSDQQTNQIILGISSLLTEKVKELTGLISSETSAREGADSTLAEQTAKALSKASDDLKKLLSGVEEKVDQHVNDLRSHIRIADSGLDDIIIPGIYVIPGRLGEAALLIVGGNAMGSVLQVLFSKAATFEVRTGIVGEPVTWSKWINLSKGAGSGSGYYNVTKEHPLPSGYYTKESAVAALAGADIPDENKPGMIITLEVSAGTWEDYRFQSSTIANFFDPAAWEHHGGADAIKKIAVAQGTSFSELRPDEQGNVTLIIPEVLIDETLTPGGTNPVQGGAIDTALKNLPYIAGITLNEIGEGDEKVYSLSTLDKEGNVMDTTGEFSGGGGGSIATTKIVLARLSDNPTVKVGDEVKLQFSYDHLDTTAGASTGNMAQVTVTVIRGVNSSAFEMTIQAGSITTLDVSKYIGSGANTVRVRVSVDTGETVQVSSLSWTVTVVQLTLASSFNIATVIHKGDTVTVPFALTGSGTKTLRLYVDGVDREDRTLSTSNANGSFSVHTGTLAHGSHSVQLVAELELPSGVIKSNSIYFDLAVRESANQTPVFAGRFDYPDGTIIPAGQRPYIPVKQYDNYTLVYAAYNPKEVPTVVSVYESNLLVSAAKVSFVRNDLLARAMSSGEISCYMECGSTRYNFHLQVSASDLAITEPTDNLMLKLSATGRSNTDVNRAEWSYNNIRTLFEGFKWGGDGWTGEALRLTDSARATIQYKPFAMPEFNASNALALMIRFRVTNVMDETAEIIRCMDPAGTGFVITTQEALMVSRGNSAVTTKFAAGEIYNIGFVAYPKASANSTEDEKLNDAMLYLYINGVMSGSVQRGASDSIYQATAQHILLGSDKCTLDVYSIRSYSVQLTDSQMLDAFLIDLGSADELIQKYNENDILDGNGKVTVDDLPDNLPYMVITGRQENGTPTVLQAAVLNDKDARYNIDEILYINRGNPALNFKCVGGCIRLQGTSSLAYPTKNYRIYFKNAQKVAGDLYLGCDRQGIGGVLQAKAVYSHRQASSSQKQSATVDCFCLKADYAESSSAHNTGLAKTIHKVLASAGELTPAQQHVAGSYPYEIRTTIDGFPIMLFYRNTANEQPVFLGKYNFNNDKSTEAVFGFLDIPGYHDQEWVQKKFGGQNPTECWEFLNNDYPMGQFKDDDFNVLADDGTPAWMKVFEARFPSDGTATPTQLKKVVSWVKSTDTTATGLTTAQKQARADKFRNELSNYFDVAWLCDYYMFTEIFGCVDQRVKNMMLAFWYKPEVDKVLGYMIFYDNDTILGVRNDGRLKYGWDIDHNSVDPELSTPEKTVYAYAGHDSVLWNNLRNLFTAELSDSYKRLRSQMSNDFIFHIFDTEQSAKFCERIYNLDALNKYVTPKTKGVDVVINGQTTTMQYSYLEAMQGSRKAHRHWWLTNRLSLFDARHMVGLYTATDLTFKGNSAAGATIKAWPIRDFYFSFVREAAVLKHELVPAGNEFSYTYNQMANVGTIFHFYGGEYAKKIDLSLWGGFTDLNIPRLPCLEELILGSDATCYTLSEIAIGDKLPMLKKLDVRNYTLLPSLNLSACSRINEVDARGCTTLSTIAFAEGTPLKKLYLPANYQTLALRSMPGITRQGIFFEEILNLRGLWIENCAQLDGLSMVDEILSYTGNQLRYLRITGLALEGDGNDLKRYFDAGLRGIDASGNTVESSCKLCGTYKLTRYMDDDTYNKYVARFDELNIKQPQYTMIEFDDMVSDDSNVTNLDNNTGYGTNKKYAPSAHIKRILDQRHRVLGKQAVEGTMTIYPLHDANSNYYADSANVVNATPALLNKSEGDVWMYEPKYWYKGINDYLKNKKYSCFSANPEMPDRPECTVYSYNDLLESGNVFASCKLLSGNGTLTASLVSDANYSVCKVDVANRKRVRFPTTNGSSGSSIICSIFTDNSDHVIKDTGVSSLNIKFSDGMYLIENIPQNATRLYFTILKTAEFDYVVVSDSDKIEDMEPEWVEHQACLCGVFEAVAIGSDLYSAINGETSAGGVTQSELKLYATRRKLQLIDYEMHKDVANLFFARYGRRDAQSQCGRGQNSAARIAGLTALIGMNDTVNPDNATQYCWYEVKNDLGVISLVQILSSNSMGYENWYGCKFEWMDKVSVPNTSASEYYKLNITMPDGSVRKVKSTAASGCIMGVVHQRYMDVVPVHPNPSNGSATTFYCDYFLISTGANRLVLRSRDTNIDEGGMVYMNYNPAPETVNANYGTRLAFRGKIVQASSVAAYKAMNNFL